MKKLVLVHGWGFSSAIFSEFASQLRGEISGEFEVELIDLPGYGENDAECPAALQDVGAKIMPKIANDSVVVGWSLGGLVALQLAIDFPKKVEQLIMLAATPCFVQKADWRIAADTELSAQFYQQVEEKGSLAVNGFYKQLAAMEQQPRNVLQEIKQQGKCCAEKDTLLRSLEILHSTDLRQQLPSIHKKITWIYGDNDQLVPAQTDLPTSNSCIEVITGAGHIPFMSQQEKCLHLIKEAVN